MGGHPGPGGLKRDARVAVKPLSRGWATDLMVRRLSGSLIEDRGDCIVVRTAANPTFFWGNFVLARTDWGDAPRWLTVFREAFPEARHVAIGVDGAPVSDVPRDAYEALGLVAEASVVLTAPATRIASAASDECELLIIDDDWRQALELSLAMDGELAGRQEHRLFCERRNAEARRLSELGRGCWLGGFVDDRLRSSLGLLTDGSGLGRYQMVQTHPEFRRRGLARGLVATAADIGLTRFGVEELVIVADPGYHAVELYHALGFVESEAQLQFQLAVY